MTTSFTRLDLAVQLAKQAGRIELKYFRQDVQSNNKNPRDLVTQADIEAEQTIIAGIKVHFPQDAILAEESGVHQGEGSEYSWTIDPLDGTGNFFKGSPDFCVMIAILQDNQPIASVIYFPIIEQLYIAEKGNGATKNGELLHVSSELKLASMYANTHMSSKMEIRKENLALYEKTLLNVRNVHVINACIGRLLCDIAEGIADFHFRVGLHLWDYLPGQLLIEEAGGKVTDLKGKTLSEEAEGVIASNGTIHNELVEFLG
ncbi:MAG TPA: inositol monophosphatase [Candidatus Saccharimonadales bacterium]|nr:inositol monophosphatase [Candidatus Saccharimonadales bacterium]